LFSRAKTLIEANCADCPKHSQAELEEGIGLALKARDKGYRDRAAVLRLLVDGYGTLGFVVLKSNPDRDEAIQRSSEFLKQLAQEAPADPNVRYEQIDRKAGSTRMIVDIDERIPKLHEILAIDPKHEKARFTLANDLFQKGEDDEALDLLRGLAASSDSENAKESAQRLKEFLAFRSSGTQVVAPVQINGEVRRGKNFEQEFGPGLVFRLGNTDDFGELGWDIEIHPKVSSKDEYSWVMTPPYHFGNVRYLSLGYSQTASQIVEKRPRGFKFVRNKADYDRARADVDILLGHTNVPDGLTAEAAFERALDDMEKISHCTGFFRVLDSRLARAADGTEVVDWMKFEVGIAICRSEVAGDPFNRRFCIGGFRVVIPSACPI